MRYFVTGATGFVGGRVARLLVEAGHQVTAVVRDPGRAADLSALGVTLAPGDVTDRESMREPMTGADGVYHIAGWYKIGAKDKQPGVAVNINGTRNVLTLMRDLEIPKGVYTSSLAVNSDTHGRMVDETYRFEGRHLSEYDRTKWFAHFRVAEPLVQMGLPLVTVMPGLIYGPGDTSSVRTTFIHYLQRRLPMLPSRTAFCWAHVDDVARGHILALERGTAGRSYIIAGPMHPLTEAFTIAEQITGIPAPRIHIPPPLMRASAALTGALERVAPVPEQYSGEYLRINAGVTYIGDNSRARRELGYEPRPLEAGLRQTLEHEMRLLDMPAR